MKTVLPFLLLMGCFHLSKAQIITPSVKANFGIDGDLNATLFDNIVETNYDDWFKRNDTNTVGIGIIDTTGAASIIAKYLTNPSSKSLPFFRKMAYPPYSIVNNRLLIDAIFMRDYHGDDSTVFGSGSSKNGMSPQNWVCPVSQGVPDKNELLDVMVHARRAGPSTSDSLWLFGGVSIQNTQGDRYFDYEMYQTNIYYDRTIRKFFGYGPDAGHTSWQFDASGNITVPGDIIFSAEYGSSTLSSIEARIWVNKASLSLTPASFNWSGTFDGATSGATYGYAGITPKSSGAFYTGTENSKATWAGPFQVIMSNNGILSNYYAGQYMEFGVNLTKLGLDPVTLLGGNPCGMPFKSIMVKSRASTSFTAALKDFVGPFDFFVAPKAAVAADTTTLCGLVGPTELRISNYLKTSVYEWYTPNGHIVSNQGDSSILVDSPGTYIVRQKLQSVCPLYATDTVVLRLNAGCFVLKNNLLSTLEGKLSGNQAFLKWSVTGNSLIEHFEIQQSTDGVHFYSLGILNSKSTDIDLVNYEASYNLNNSANSVIYFRLKIYSYEGKSVYSKIIRLLSDGNKSLVRITPNPVSNEINVNISTSSSEKIQLEIYDISGRIMRKVNYNSERGNNTIKISDFQSWPAGIYTVKVILNKEVFINKIVLKR